MPNLRSHLLPALLLISAIAASAAEPKLLFSERFDQAAIGKLPEGMLVLSGAFAVQAEAEKRFLELPGSPLDSFGLLFGPNEKAGMNAHGKFFGTKQGRKFPTFGLSIQGVGGYRLQISPAKNAIELFKGDESLAAVPFQWTTGAWTSLRIQSRPASDGKWRVEGKAWPAAQPEPATWTISLEAETEPPAGRPGLWGSPFSGTPIRFDDLVITAAH